MTKVTAPQTGQIRVNNQRKILQSAEFEFARNGYKGSSLQAIAERSGLPKANILYYYPSKLALYEAVLDNIVMGWNVSFDHVSVDDDPAESLVGYIRDKIRFSNRNPDAARVFTGEILHGANILNDRFKGEARQWLEKRVTVIQGWIDQGRMNPIDPRHLLFMIWSMTQHYVDYEAQVLYMLNRSALSQKELDKATETIVKLVLGGCGLEVPESKRSTTQPEPVAEPG
ncbi:TetR/AcrR family transcriptional regulator [Parendozoicomonas sp. Alg238-R29]|uniref:TetR/AcrR family transcriptional regulator n=1 Tax=Parendozoicomonas sp. Alg238-R29 TaxID=2993446 RepID=UPI00248ECA65|nr:TetR/AcrR family transcriptional regulator [Parendozoicomonas sp. Alg238-R29]